MAREFDDYNSGEDSLVASSASAEAVTPHDTNALSNTTKGLYIGGAGAVVVRLLDDDDDTTFAAVPAGMILPVRATHVRLTGTAATSIVALF